MTMGDDALTTREASTAPVGAPNRAPGDDTEEEMPRAGLSRSRMVAVALFFAFAIGFLYFVLPRLAGLRETWNRIDSGEPGWLAVAAGFEVLSFGGYIVLFRTVFVRGSSRIDWRESYQITMAGLAATRLLAAGGAGGVALTAWALKRSGMDGHTVTRRMTAFLVILYGVYMGALLVDGAGLATGLWGVHAPAAVTIAPAAFGGIVIASALLMSRLRPVSVAPSDGRVGRIRLKLRHITLSIAAGVRGALGLARSREVGLLGAFAWWGFDIAVLWASFHAFGAVPPISVIIMGYFVGTLANTLPLPGGIGGVEGGMVGALVAFGVDPGLAVLAVLAYRGFAFWLPIVPGAIAFFTLRRTVVGWEAEDAARAAVASVSWKASASSTILSSRSGYRTWPSRCRVSSRSPGLTMPSSSPST